MFNHFLFGLEVLFTILAFNNMNFHMSVESAFVKETFSAVITFKVRF